MASQIMNGVLHLFKCHMLLLKCLCMCNNSVTVGGIGSFPPKILIQRKKEEKTSSGKGTYSTNFPWPCAQVIRHSIHINHSVCKKFHNDGKKLFYLPKNVL